MKIDRSWPDGVYVREVPQFEGKLFAQMVTVAGASTQIESPRLFRRPFCLSQAASAWPSNCS